MLLLKPTIIYPKEAFLPPPIPYLPYGIKIPENEVIYHLQSESDVKAIVIFVGGFCDTIMRAVYQEFLHFDQPLCYKIYTSFRCQKLFTLWLTQLAEKKLPLFVIAHSWGACNFYKALIAQANAHISIDYLLTLDPVGYTMPKKPPTNVQWWDNVYITHKTSNLVRPNIVALIGHSWNLVSYANYNASLQKPFHHASIRQMIEASNFTAKLDKIIKNSYKNVIMP
ncbi:hypothetical protein LS68_006250 [Helicobacter sp. MIT 05-5293]|uniref:hypothetical protein n=1 Tax=Helicobacter sp. MIT 05-5293 TaxID=1548149 RepID=UPI000A84BF8B|nr:hypothetical protein [Helicobacter sp. MIT 05-5293]TLD81062.1 hypothetical protein LS68_006250 [Helicobacter sp. MIT 05-5293]